MKTKTPPNTGAAIASTPANSKISARTMAQWAASNPKPTSPKPARPRSDFYFRFGFERFGIETQEFVHRTSPRGELGKNDCRRRVSTWRRACTRGELASDGGPARIAEFKREDLRI